MKADVYFNLHTHLWSVKDRKSGLVTEHARVVYTSLPCGFVVQPAGHKRVLQTKQKNVHAFVRGDWLYTADDIEGWTQYAAELDTMVPVSYNPFRGPSFYRKDTGQDITEAKGLIMLAPYSGPSVVMAHM